MCILCVRVCMCVCECVYIHVFVFCNRALHYNGHTLAQKGQTAQEQTCF